MARVAGRDGHGERAMTAVLECADLVHTYPGRPRPVLRGVGLSVAAGERVALVGRSGSGKSTLVRALLALEAVESGVVRCAGRPVAPGPVRRLRWFRRIVQYVPQDPASTLDPRARVRDIVAEPARRLRGDDGDTRVALESVEIPAELHGARVRDLSGGQAQRVAIARAWSPGPQLILADEPVSGLDPPLRARVTGALRTLSERRGTALLLVTHDLSVAARLCDRIVVMHDGRIVEDRDAAGLLAGPAHPETRALLAAVPRLA
ncbi:ABC transporter ATP-binding protein [Catenuloplanes indicus]|uniref:Peptide/nickel transport system ATP-binding protein n=1 Tax=Catenuloplanes indicus TaxID=137267 RepID=A0AAE4AVX9_9ACTN|nr:ABC transporter ATP-binding protein [Catenuloplanes indicus]MDQ0364141.1 peptide/nickel transport system ATP-binding protein [Catenuloplanes indicus]